MKRFIFTLLIFTFVAPVTIAETWFPKAPVKYDRDLYPHWNDEDGDGMNLRHELLKEVSQTPVVLSPDGRYVKYGTFWDPYSGKVFFKSSDLQIDHVVSLYYAHHRGAWKFSPEQKEAFANDVDNLLVVKAQLNRDKSWYGPWDYLPPNTQYHCTLILKFDAVMNKYNLSYSNSEQKRMNRMLGQCQSAG